jgi:hypothetical protein
MNFDDQPPTGAKTGMSSHQSATAVTHEWLTPRWILDPLGKFDLDPCAPVTRPWDTAAQHFTIEDNGLMRPWHGRVWLNPPYGDETSRWMGRMKSHNVGLSLIFARTETDTWQDHVFPAATAIFFFRRRIRFYRPDGTPGKYEGGAPSAMIAYGMADALIMASAGYTGHFVMLKPVV